MTKMTTIIISTIVLLSCSLVLFIYLWFNIASHSVYYAHHMPHAKGTNPELVMTIKYLDQIRIPKGKGLRVNLDGNNILLKDNKYVISYDNSYKDREIITLRFFSNDDEHLEDFSFLSKTGNFVFSRDLRKWDKRVENFLETTSVRTKTKSNDMINQVLNPIIKYQVKPKVNLQWLFNMIYQSQFDEMEQISSTELLEY
ncbi:hypothetical protein [Streptococcus thoraltensis]|uniref:hypothetical protein n=1 Tax=Streptococcus thoraltensis TaxID=55085 RepID=UPI001F5AB6B6|nr:hypothetical protein [Streptococcus thoraltensis]